MTEVQLLFPQANNGTVSSNVTVADTLDEKNHDKCTCGNQTAQYAWNLFVKLHQSAHVC